MTEKLDAILDLAKSNENKKEDTNVVASAESNEETEPNDERKVEDDDFELLD